MAEQKLLWSELWDIADTSYRYGVYGEVQTGQNYIKTSGSSTTVTEANSGDGTFQAFAAGDLISVKAGADGAWSTRILTAVASAASVTVNSAITLAGNAWSYRKWYNGTASTDGWFSVRDYSTKSVQWQWVTDNATSATFTLEGRIHGGTGSELYTQTFTAVGSALIAVPEWCDEIRVGAKIDTDGGVNAVKVTFSGERFVG